MQDEVLNAFDLFQTPRAIKVALAWFPFFLEISHFFYIKIHTYMCNAHVIYLVLLPLKCTARQSMTQPSNKKIMILSLIRLCR